MNKSAKQQAALQQLHSLREQPDKQARYALELLERERASHQVVSEALGVLTHTPAPSAGTRLALLRLYDYYDASGVKRDAGGSLRTLIIGALLPIAGAGDWELAERAAKTYEFLPPSRRESTSGLRAAGLTLLNNLDPLLAGYHATRLLVDAHTSRMSGEPAVGAVRLLATQRQLLPLYEYVLNSLRPDDKESVPEVVGECLRSLVDAPLTIIDDLYARYIALAPVVRTPVYETRDDVELVGLFDLLLPQASQATYLDFIKTFLQLTKRYEVYHYLVTLIVAGHQPELWAMLQDMARKERNPQKIEMLLSAFEPLQHDPAIASMMRALQER